MNYFNQNLPSEISEYMQNPHNTESRKKLVGEQLALIRTKAGLTQKDVCSIIEITPQTYSGYEKGKHEPTLETLVRLSILYGTSLNFMLCRHNDDSSRAVEHGEEIIENGRLEALAEEVAILKAEIDEIKRNKNRTLDQ